MIGKCNSHYTTFLLSLLSEHYKKRLSLLILFYYFILLIKYLHIFQIFKIAVVKLKKRLTFQFIKESITTPLVFKRSPFKCMLILFNCYVIFGNYSILCTRRKPN